LRNVFEMQGKYWVNLKTKNTERQIIKKELYLNGNDFERNPPDPLFQRGRFFLGGKHRTVLCPPLAGDNAIQYPTPTPPAEDNAIQYPTPTPPAEDKVLPIAFLLYFF
jgi:hypothetical protein